MIFGPYTLDNGRTVAAGRSEEFPFPDDVFNGYDPSLCVWMQSVFNSPVENGHLTFGDDGAVEMSEMLLKWRPDWTKYVGVRIAVGLSRLHPSVTVLRAHREFARYQISIGSEPFGKLQMWPPLL